MWVIEAVVLFFVTASGVGIPPNRYEGPFIVADEDRKPIQYRTEAECEGAALTEQPGWQAIERHKHQTDDLEVGWRCKLEQKDL